MIQTVEGSRSPSASVSFIRIRIMVFWFIRAFTLSSRAIGGVLPNTLTMVWQVLTLPYRSVTYSVTIFSPTFSQVRNSGSILSEGTPQLSKLPPSTMVGESLTCPFGPIWMSTLWQMATGAMVSFTVTMASQTSMLPDASTTVSLTGFGPTLLQSKLVRSRVLETIWQLSVEPLSISAGVMLALPFSSR